jgi:hypothetical protein
VTSLNPYQPPSTAKEPESYATSIQRGRLILLVIFGANAALKLWALFTGSPSALHVAAWILGVAVMVLAYLGHYWAHLLTTFAFGWGAFRIKANFPGLDGTEYALWLVYMLGSGLALWLPSVRAFLAQQQANRDAEGVP